jgi:hypothetical protein
MRNELIAEIVGFHVHGVQLCHRFFVTLKELIEQILIDLAASQREFQPCLGFACFLHRKSSATKALSHKDYRIFL